MCIYISEENLVHFMVMMDFRCYGSCFIYIDLQISVTQQAIISDFANFVPALVSITSGVTSITNIMIKLAENINKVRHMWKCQGNFRK